MDRFRRCRRGVEGAAGGDVANGESLDADLSCGQCLNAFALVSEVVSVVRPAARSIFVELGAKAPAAVSKVFTQDPDFRDEFGASRAEVSTKVVPPRNLQGSQRHAHDQGCDEFS